MVKNMRRGNLVILVGIDGSGKSTLLANLENKGYFTSHWRKLKDLPLWPPLNFENPGEVVQTLKGQNRLRFIWRYISAEWKYLIKPKIVAGRNVLSDGFFIRFFAKEKTYRKLPIKELEKRSPLTGSEFVVMIDLPPDIAYERKRDLKISPYEYFETPFDFIKFQSLQRRKILSYIKMKRFPYVVVDGNKHPTQLANEVLKLLEERKIYP